MCVALQSGYQRYSAMADGGSGDGEQLAPAWGVPRTRIPWAAPWFHGRRTWDRNVVEATLGAWAGAACAGLGPSALAAQGRAHFINAYTTHVPKENLR